MKHNYLLPGLLALLPVVVAATLLLTNSLPGADAAPQPFRCTNNSFYFPSNGLVGWTYGDPASTDLDAHGHRTIHTGVDVFSVDGDGAPVYAPADGVVSRKPGVESVNLLLPGVTNALTGEDGVEIYISHIVHALVPGQEVRAGEVIGFYDGLHVHLSVGAFIGYDDREIEETQDPSPYFHAALTYDPATIERKPVDHWCLPGRSSVALTSFTTNSNTTTATVEHVVRSGDTLTGIAERYDVSVSDIVDANDLDDPDFISIGQVLTIPGASGSGANTASTSTSSGGSLTPLQNSATYGPHQTYTVKDGDTLWDIALKFDTDVEDIVALNNLKDPDVLAIGDELQIP